MIFKTLAKFISYFFLIFPLMGWAVEICKKPCAVVYSPHSVLRDRPDPNAIFFHDSKRWRVSTCTDVCWTPDDAYLLAMNLELCSMQVYAFDAENEKLTLVKEFDKDSGLVLLRPSDMAISRDGNLLAVANLCGNYNVYLTDPVEILFPTPILNIPGAIGHGVRFSRNNRYLICLNMGAFGVDMYSISPFKHVQRLGTPFAPLSAKSADFSCNGHFVAISYCTMLTNEVMPRSVGKIATYSFDLSSGRINPIPISQTDDWTSVETVHFHPSGKTLFAVDQGSDRIIGLEFDENTGIIGKSWVALEGEESELSFPHAIAFTSDGRFAAIANHGDDKITLYRLLE